MIITIIISLIFFSSLFNPKVNIYELLSSGIKDGLKQTINLSTTIITITLVVEMFINSGIIELLQKMLPFTNIPPEIFLQLIIKPISYNSSLIFMIQIFDKYGVNHVYSYLSSIIQGAFDSTIFVCALYFGEIKNKYFKKTISNALLVNCFSASLSIILWYLFFKII